MRGIYMGGPEVAWGRGRRRGRAELGLRAAAAVVPCARRRGRGGGPAAWARPSGRARPFFLNCSAENIS